MTYLSLSELFERQVIATPDSLAVICGEQRLTYSELNERANRLGRSLARSGVGPDTLVGICMERSVEMVIAIYGILKAGGAYVPFDPAYPRERLLFMLKDAQVRVMLTQKRRLDKTLSSEFNDRRLELDWNSVLGESGQNLESKPRSEDLAYVIYTSGSTGHPKGVMISHGAICNHMLWMQDTFPLTERDRVLQKTPFSFDASVWEFFAPLLAGAPLIMAEPDVHRDGDTLIKAINENGITILQVVPSVLKLLLETPAFASCRSLKRVFCGGEALSSDLVDRFASISNAMLCNLYGPTEATIDATYWVCSGRNDKSVVPIGRPIANTQVHLLDGQLQRVPIGVAGELCIGGRGLARGYWGQPKLTEEKFVPNPFSDREGERLYKTGDLARYLSDGNIEILGRIDHQVKIRGFRIEPGEIESVLRRLPGIRDAVVLKDDANGESRLLAFLVTPRTYSTTDPELRASLKTHLPDYMIPSVFVRLETLPLMPNGKVDRKKMLARDFENESIDFEPPHTDMERQLATIWCEVLEIKKVGRHENFFELGGHSLLAARITSRIRRVCGKALSLSGFFDFPTIATLGLLLEKSEPSGLENPTILVSRRSQDV